MRALERLSRPTAVLAPERGGASYGIFAQGDRRCRPVARLTPAEVDELDSSGAIASISADGVRVITEAGRARVRREAADPGEEFVAQHGPVVSRASIDAQGAVRPARGLEPNALIRRLSALRGARGGEWLSGAELAAAAQLRSHWERAQSGLVRGSDWTAPPKALSGRGRSNGQEAALAARCDARRRVAEALDRLAFPLRRVVERVCLHEDGLEALERVEHWPARSGKLALKLGLAQLALSL